ncbi:hypothetical protein GCM10027341_33280 [Spirosoma knui]
MTILVPIDFRVASLNTLRWALEQVDAPSVNVVLLYCERLDDSITELLFYSPKRIVKDLMTPDFEDAINILINHFENKIGELKIELFHGKVQSTFDTLLDTLKIDKIYLAQFYQLQLPKQAFDPLPYIRKTHIPYREIAWIPQEVLVHQDSLEHLFL